MFHLNEYFSVKRTGLSMLDDCLQRAQSVCSVDWPTGLWMDIYKTLWMYGKASIKVRCSFGFFLSFFTAATIYNCACVFGRVCVCVWEGGCMCVTVRLFVGALSRGYHILDCSYIHDIHKGITVKNLRAGFQYSLHVRLYR